MATSNFANDLLCFRQSNGLAAYLLLPGEIACTALDVVDPDSRLLLRMFVNLTVYAKIGLLAIMAIV